MREYLERGRRMLNIVVVLLAALLFFPWDLIYSVSPNLTQMLSPPTLSHPLGTDHLGRDLLGQLALASRATVLPLWLTTCFATGVGVLFGLLHTGLGDTKLLRPLLEGIAALLSFAVAVPFGIAAFGFALFLGEPGLPSLVLTVFVLIAVKAFHFIINRSKEDEKKAYWIAHEAMGGTKFQRVWRYGILAGWRQKLLWSLIFNLQIVVTVESALAYLGFGVQEPSPSYGNILSSHLDQYLQGQWWVPLVASVTLLLVGILPPVAARLALIVPRQAFRFLGRSA